MSTTVCVPDMHIYNDSKLELIRAMIKTIEVIDPDILVYMGDKGDPWEDTWESVLFTKSWNLLLGLEKGRFDKGSRNIWIHYNHDASAKQGYGRHCELVRGFKYGNFEFMHGYEFDIVWGGWGFVPGVHRIGFWLSRRFPNFSVKLWKWMRWNKNTAPSQMMSDVHTQDLMHYHIGMMHARELSYAVDKNVRLVVGHSHCPVAYEPYLYDVGCIEDRKLLVIRDDKVTSLDF